MIERSLVVAEARSWLECPFHHQGRLKTIGVDCVGLVLCVAKQLKLIEADFDVQGYSRIPDGVNLLHIADSKLIRITKEEMQPGDILVVSFDKEPQHLGILGNYRHGGLSIIHAAGGGGNDKVIETRLMFSSAMKFVAVYKLPGVK